MIYSEKLTQHFFRKAKQDLQIMLVSKQASLNICIHIVRFSINSTSCTKQGDELSATTMSQTSKK